MYAQPADCVNLSLAQVTANGYECCAAERWALTDEGTDDRQQWQRNETSSTSTEPTCEQPVDIYKGFEYQANHPPLQTILSKVKVEFGSAITAQP